MDSGWAVEIIPPRVGQRALADLATVMQALVSRVGRPVALELVGMANARRFVVRAANQEDLARVVAQLRARYPQAEFRSLDAASDPLILRAGEAVSIAELQPGAASYLPLRSWDTRDWEREGADPLLGQLAALADLPHEVRAIAQLGLMAASDGWSQSRLRYALEHPLERERSAGRSEFADTHLGSVLCMLLLVAGLVAWQQLRFRVPGWLTHTLLAVVHGKPSVLTPAQSAHLWFVGVGFGIALAGLLLLLLWSKRHWQAPLYDQRLAREKLTLPAYRVRLRLIVIGPRLTLENPLAMGVSPRASIDRGWQAGAARLPHVTAFTARELFRRILGWWDREMHRGRGRAQRVWRRWCARHIQARARWDVIEGLIAAYRQFHLATGAYFVPYRLPGWRARQLARAHGRRNAWWLGWRQGIRGSHHYMSIADVAALWHLPQGSDLPDLGWLDRTRARTRLVPEILMREGYRIGMSEHAGQRVPVLLPATALQRNVLAVAKSGKGKSTLLLALAQAALREGDSGVFLVDPHGDLCDALLANIPLDRRAQVILVDLADRAYPVGINPLDVTAFGERDLVVSQLISIFSAIWSRTWGSRMEAALEMALKTLYEVNRSLVADPQRGPAHQYTLLDVGPLLTVQAFRHDLMRRVADPHVRAWWYEQFEPKPWRDKLEMISPVLTKMNKFAASTVARRIVGQARTTVSFAEAITLGRIVLVRTARGVVGEDVAAIVGASLLGLATATMARQAEMPQEQRHRVQFIIDEFQALPGVAWGQLLAELRKYRASFALATQALAQLDRLDPALRPTVFANIEHLFAFGMSAEDARLIERELDGVVESADLINLDDFVAYCKITLAGRRSPVFSLQLDPPTVGDPRAAATIRAFCQERLGVPAAQVDAAVQAALDQHTRFTLTTDVPGTSRRRAANGEGQAAVDEPVDVGKKTRRKTAGGARRIGIAWHGAPPDSATYGTQEQEARHE